MGTESSNSTQNSSTQESSSHHRSHHRHHHDKSTTKRVNFFEGVWAGFSGLLNFKGRMRRSEYWWFFAFSLIVGVVAYFGFLTWQDEWEQTFFERFQTVESWRMFPYVYTTYTMPVYFVVGLLFSAQVRRFHDVGKRAWIPFIKTGVFVLLAWYVYRLTHAAVSFDINLGVIGWLLLIAYVALAIVIAVVACIDSEKERNRYGKSSKYRRKIYENLPPPPSAPKRARSRK